MIYLDNAATTYPKPEIVYKEIDKCLREYGANPGRSGHKLALQAGRTIFETRELVAKLFNIDDPMQIVFTNNATAALNLGIKGFLKKGDHVILTSMEHNSVVRPIKEIEKIGIEHTIVECSPEGILNINDLEAAIKDNTKLIVTTHASNVTGTIMPVKEIGEIAEKHRVAYLLDAAQSAGVYNIDVKEMHIDMLAVPGHKGLMGPQGTGLLYIKKGLDVCQMMEGGTGSKSELTTQPEMMPDKFESGTPNTPGIAGLGAGIKFILETGMERIRNHEESLTDYMLTQLMEIEEIEIYGPKDASKQAAVISFNIKGRGSSEIGYYLDNLFDIAVRPGLHCAPLAHETIGTLEQGTVRFSIGYFNTKEEIDEAIKGIKTICKQRV